MTARDLPVDELRAFARSRGLRRLSLFGSFLRGQARAGSDIDLLVELPPGHAFGLLELAEMECELSEMLGVPVDLRTPAELSPLFRNDVMREAEVLYDAA